MLTYVLTNSTMTHRLSSIYATTLDGYATSTTTDGSSNTTNDDFVTNTKTDTTKYPCSLSNKLSSVATTNTTTNTSDITTAPFIADMKLDVTNPNSITNEPITYLSSEGKSNMIILIIIISIISSCVLFQAGVCLVNKFLCKTMTYSKLSRVEVEVEEMN